MLADHDSPFMSEIKPTPLNERLRSSTKAEGSEPGGFAIPAGRIGLTWQPDRRNEVATAREHDGHHTGDHGPLSQKAPINLPPSGARCVGIRLSRGPRHRQRDAPLDRPER